MHLIKFIPNLFTLGNLALGVLGIGGLLTGSLEVQQVSYMILLAAVLDFFDGFLAKALKAQSEIGAQLDSLADLVTFGVLPGFIYWHLAPNIEWNWIVVLVPLCSAWRLAKFNVDTDQTDSFKGISTTAHGIFVATIPLFIAASDTFLDEFLNTELHLLVLSIVFSLLMISNIRMISLKFSTFSVRANWDRYVLLLTALVSIIILGWSASPFILILYLALSLYNHLNSK